MVLGKEIEPNGWGTKYPFEFIKSGCLLTNLENLEKNLFLANHIEIEVFIKFSKVFALFLIASSFFARRGFTIGSVETVVILYLWKPCESLS